MDENKNPFGGKPVLNPSQPADIVPNPPGPQPPQTPPPIPPPSQDVPPPPSGPAPEHTPSTPAAEEPDSGDGPGVSAEDLEQGGLPPIMPAPPSGGEPTSANKRRLGVVVGIVAAILMLTAIPGGVYLVQQRQQYISQARSTASEAGDNAWNSCKIAGGSDQECRQQAEAAYMSVANQVNISPEEAHEDQVRDAFRQKALSDVGGSEKLTPQLKDQIQQQSDQIAKDPSTTSEQAIQAAEKLVASFEEGAKCTYPEEFTDKDGKKKVRVCNGLRKEGKCEFNAKVDPACKEVTPGEAGTSSDTKLTFPAQYTDYVYFDCDKCSPDRKCQTPNIGVNPRFFAGQAPHASCRQRDICNPKTNDCLLVSLCDESCSGPAPAGAPQIAQTPAQETAECKNIKIYDSAWKQLSKDDIKAGDTVRLAVSGTTTEAKGLTKARFRINSGSWKETTQKNPGKEFFTEFQVPTAGGNFKVEAMVFNPDLGWK